MGCAVKPGPVHSFAHALERLVSGSSILRGFDACALVIRSEDGGHHRHSCTHGSALGRAGNFTGAAVDRAGTGRRDVALLLIFCRSSPYYSVSLLALLGHGCSSGQLAYLA